MNETETRVVSSEVDQDEQGIILTFHVMADVQVSKQVLDKLKIAMEENEHLLKPFQDRVSEILNTEGSQEANSDNNDSDFKVTAGIRSVYINNRISDHLSMDLIKLKDGLSDDALRHITLEAQYTAPKLLQPLMRTIRNIENKDLNKITSNPNDDVCESCQ